jgi:hypothetical protein
MHPFPEKSGHPYTFGALYKAHVLAHVARMQLDKNHVSKLASMRIKAWRSEDSTWYVWATAQTDVSRWPCNRQSDTSAKFTIVEQQGERGIDMFHRYMRTVRIVVMFM